MESNIVALARRILDHATEINKYLTTNNLPTPSFSADVPLDTTITTPIIEASRIAAMEDCLELHDLLLGPKMLVRPMYNGSSLQAIYRFDIPSKVPLSGEISYADLAARCNVHEPDLKRILRFAMCYHRTFREVRKGFVSHSAASRSIAESQDVRDALGVMFEDCYPAYARTVDAMERFPGRGVNETGYTLAHDTDLPFYKHLAVHPERSARFAGAMRAFEGGPDISPSYLISGFDWASLGNGLIVDVGGSLGAVSIAIAEAFPSLRFIVQDRPDVIQESSSQRLPDTVKDRVEFMAHDFTRPQTVTGDVYLYRHIFHNWPDAYVVEILRQLVSAMKLGARVLINETLLPEPGTASLTREREVRSMDMLMLTLCNGRERDADDWKAIFQEADPRFEFVGAWIPEGSSLGIVEATWTE